MKGTRGRKRIIDLTGRLGHLIPPGALSPGRLERELVETMDRHRFLGGFGVPSAPTRYVVRMNPADRVQFSPYTEDRLARALARHAETAGVLLLGPLEVELVADADLARGTCAAWAGFGDRDLLVLAAPKAALDVFARA
jgi:hypothetical protein